ICYRGLSSASSWRFAFRFDNISSSAEEVVGHLLQRFFIRIAAGRVRESTHLETAKTKIFGRAGARAVATLAGAGYRSSGIAAGSAVRGTGASCRPLAPDTLRRTRGAV
ncbi:hypothetical protein PENTCL1PPCAC_19594, partial [Pristionchus entomophagus]